jgi:thiaminase (transcriptional activator TenA)
MSRYPDNQSQMGANVMPERFTETLRAASEPGWSQAVGHRFVNELFAGTLPDAVMARYLIQDHRFLDSFLMLLGAVLASADTFEARLRFGRFIGMVSSEENTYFLRAFEALGVTEDRRAADPDTQPTAGFKAIMREAAETRSYAAVLSVLVVTEWLYLDWASRAPTPPNNFVPLSTSCARSWTGSAPRRRIYAATSSVGLSPSNSPFSTPLMPTEPDATPWCGNTG